MRSQLVRCALLLSALLARARLEEWNIVFKEADLSTTIGTAEEELRLDAYKAAGNDRLLQRRTQAALSQLQWYSLGDPRLVRSDDPRNSSRETVVDFKWDRVGVIISTLTTSHRSALAAAAKDKYGVVISERQFQQIPLASVTCEVAMTSEAGHEFLLIGNAINVQQFPIHVDFITEQNSPARQLLRRLMDGQPDGLKVDCTFNSKGRQVTSNTLELSPDQIEQLAIVSKLFGRREAVYVTREQLVALSSELYAALSILEEYTMPLHPFVDAFISELLQQTMNTSFSSVDVDKALGELSSYGLQADDTSRVIRLALSSTFSVKNVGNSRSIVLNKVTLNKSSYQRDESPDSNSSTIALFGIRIGPSSWSTRQAVSSSKSLEGQLEDLNSFPESDVRWSREMSRLVPRSIRVALLWKSRFKKTLRFSRISRQDTVAPFASKVRMEVTETALTTTLGESVAFQAERNEMTQLQSSVELLNTQQSQQEYREVASDVASLTRRLQQQPQQEDMAELELLISKTAARGDLLREECEQLETVHQMQDDQLQEHDDVLVELESHVALHRQQLHRQQEAIAKVKALVNEMAEQQYELRKPHERLERQQQQQQHQLATLEFSVFAQAQQLQRLHVEQGTLRQNQRDQLHREDQVIAQLQSRVDKQQSELKTLQDRLWVPQEELVNLESRVEAMATLQRQLLVSHQQFAEVHLKQLGQQQPVLQNLTRQQQQLQEEWQRLPLLRMTLTAEEKRLVSEWRSYWEAKKEHPAWQHDTILCYASFEGEISVVEALLVRGDYVDGACANGQTPLHLASMRGKTNVVLLLVQNSADINDKDVYGWTPLHQVSDNGYIEAAEVLIRAGADINAKTIKGWTPLHLASFHGSSDVVNLLLQNGADVNLMDNERWTSLYWASENGKTEVVRLLLENGADVNGTDKNGWTPLHWASRNGSAGVVKLLLQKGVDVDVRDNDGWTPLHRACEHADVIKLLLQNGADVSRVDNNGMTPLHWASYYGKPGAVLLLLQSGADVNYENYQGKTPLHVASENGQPDVVKLLLENGADVNGTDNDGWTSLHWAGRNGSTDVVKQLLQNGADVNGADKHGWTPLHRASWNGNADVVALLVQNGADINGRDKYGLTPLHRASEHGRTDVVRLLLSYEADVNIKDKTGKMPRDVVCAWETADKRQANAIRRLFDE